MPADKVIDLILVSSLFFWRYVWSIMELHFKENLKERAIKLKTDIPTIFLALKDKETPFLAKIFAGITVVYALSPIDFIPDFIPVLGYMDDVIILPVLVALTIKFIPKEILEKNRKLSESLWENGKPKKWYYALPIIIIWVIIIYLVLRVFLR